MATITMDDGSQLDLTQDEFVLYLQATGKVVEPKSQAEIIADKMIELRNGSTIDPTANVEEEHAAQAIIQSDPDYDDIPITHHQRIEAAVQATTTGLPVEIGNFRIMPGGHIVPKHVEFPGGKPPARKQRIPFTEQEMAVMNALKSAHRPVKTRYVAAIVGRDHKDVTGTISRIFNTGRGIARGPHCTWSVEPWALRADWWQHGYPINHWPEKEVGSKT